ncbi:hypothetical protein E2C01_099050 [Portunus trituberculatus]|uniref:Uncharacterized protein n=1 Tax=Portunus trituberculatus TaxID=210409 RepID=A0A5B7JZA8_PORTR|nr:hypothetical protein [Portunus trituberculatus]
MPEFKPGQRGRGRRGAGVGGRGNPFRAPTAMNRPSSATPEGGREREVVGGEGGRRKRKHTDELHDGNNASLSNPLTSFQLTKISP